MRSIVATLSTVALLIGACGTGDAATTSGTPSSATQTTTSPGAVASPAPTTAVPATTTDAAAGSASTTAPPTTPPARADAVIEVTVSGGAVTGPDRPDISLGSNVLFVVTADVADEVHVHGYDYYLDLTPGTTAELEFVADIPGIFEVELERSRIVLTELVIR